MVVEEINPQSNIFWLSVESSKEYAQKKKKLQSILLYLNFYMQNKHEASTMSISFPPKKLLPL